MKKTSAKPKSVATATIAAAKPAKPASAAKPKSGAAKKPPVKPGERVVNIPNLPEGCVVVVVPHSEGMGAILRAAAGPRTLALARTARGLIQPAHAALRRLGLVAGRADHSLWPKN